MEGNKNEAFIGQSVWPYGGLTLGITLLGIKKLKQSLQVKFISFIFASTKQTMATKKLPKLAQRQTCPNGYTVAIGLTGDVGYISIEDRNLYPDGDSRSDRRDAGFNTMMIPCMTREDLKDLHTAIGEVLKNSR